MSLLSIRGVFDTEDIMLVSMVTLLFSMVIMFVSIVTKFTGVIVNAGMTSTLEVSSNTSVISLLCSLEVRIDVDSGTDVPVLASVMYSLNRLVVSNVELVAIGLSFGVISVDFSTRMVDSSVDIVFGFNESDVCGAIIEAVKSRVVYVDAAYVGIMVSEDVTVTIVVDDVDIKVVVVNSVVVIVVEVMVVVMVVVVVVVTKIIILINYIRIKKIFHII